MHSENIKRIRHEKRTWQKKIHYKGRRGISRNYRLWTIGRGNLEKVVSRSIISCETAVRGAAKSLLIAQIFHPEEKPNTEIFTELTYQSLGLKEDQTSQS